MKHFQNLLVSLLSFSLLSAIIVGAYVVLRYIVHLFTDLELHIVSTTYAVAIVVLSSMGMIFLIWRLGQKRKDTKQSHDKKAEVYQNFLEVWSIVLSCLVASNNINMNRLNGGMKVAEQQLILWGSSKVIGHYVAYQQHDTSYDPRNPETLLLIEKVILEMRMELGQSNLGIQTGDLLYLLLYNTPHGQSSTNTMPQGSQVAHRLFDGVSYPSTA